MLNQWIRRSCAIIGVQQRGSRKHQGQLRIISVTRQMMTDPAMLKRILTNLINNAIQAMPNGISLIFQPIGKTVRSLLKLRIAEKAPQRG